MNSSSSTPPTLIMGVRKGSWAEEEDLLLRKCIQKYGEGKWHLVPARAGLNRCRKSCRLRWLNYLRPHIKRGDFAEDEVDLILRLHKLLGNRWSLIAGRLPGRTANDVKNYWNTHLQRKLTTIPLPPPPPRQKIIKNKCKDIIISKNEIIRCKPRKYFASTNKNIIDKVEKHCNEIIISNEKQTAAETSTDNDIQWWTNILENCNETLPSLLHQKPLINGEGNSNMQQGQTDYHAWDDFSLDIDLWDLLN